MSQGSNLGQDSQFSSILCFYWEGEKGAITQISCDVNALISYKASTRPTFPRVNLAMCNPIVTSCGL